jgi:NIPSNAP
MRQKVTFLVVVLGLGAAFGAGWLAAAAEKPIPDERVFELRTYKTLPGRLDALNARFANHTLKLFEKHGMKNLYYWTPSDQPETMIYVLEHRSRAAAEESWKGFRADPDWHAARDASEQSGKIVEKVDSVYLKLTDYSPVR